MQNCNYNRCNHHSHTHETMHGVDNLPLAMGYVPWQHFDTVFEVDKALQQGTIFPELCKPFLGKRGMHK